MGDEEEDQKEQDMDKEEQMIEEVVDRAHRRGHEDIGYEEAADMIQRRNEK